VIRVIWYCDFEKRLAYTTRGGVLNTDFRVCLWDRPEVNECTKASKKSEVVSSGGRPKESSGLCTATPCSSYIPLFCILIMENKKHGVGMG